MLAIALALLLGGVPEASTRGIPVYVGVMPREDGFVDADKGVLDSVKDLENALAKRGLVLVGREGAAKVKLYVTWRGERETGGATIHGTSTTTAVGTSTVTIGGITTTTDMHGFLHVQMQAGDYRKVHVKAAQPTNTWKGAANEIAKDVEAWIAANRGKLLSMPTTPSAP
jgi:hypothetical protein